MTRHCALLISGAPTPSHHSQWVNLFLDCGSTAPAFSFVPARLPPFHPLVQPDAPSAQFRCNFAPKISRLSTTLPSPPRMCGKRKTYKKLKSFRYHTYRKRGGVLLLTRNSRKNFYPEGAPRLKDLASFPAREFVLTERTDSIRQTPEAVGSGGFSGVAGESGSLAISRGAIPRSLTRPARVV